MYALPRPGGLLAEDLRANSALESQLHGRLAGVPG